MMVKIPPYTLVQFLGSTSTKNNSVVGGGIYLANSSPKLINVTITENKAERGGGIHFGMGSRGYFCPSDNGSKPVFDNNNRCNIYLNYAPDGSDLAGVDSSINVVVDTFTVLNPTDFHATPFNNYSFDIMNSKIEHTNSDLYVSPFGNNNNSGLSLDEPQRTILSAFVKISADSLNPRTIYLADGVYLEDIWFKDYVSVVGESKSGVIIGSESYPGTGISVKFDFVKSASLENLTIIGDGENTRGIYSNFSNPFIKNVTLEGARIWMHASDAYIENVKISGNLDETGIEIHSSSSTLMNVEVTDNSGWYEAGGLFVGSNSHVIMINSTVSGNTSLHKNFGGISTYMSSLKIVNSIIWNNSQYEIGINWGDDPNTTNTSISVSNSLLKDGENGITGGGYNLYWLNGNIDSDPMFVDTSIADYRLQEGSPAIDKGIQDTMIVYNGGNDTLYIPPMDFRGPAPDMGAYEYGDPLKIEEAIIALQLYSLGQNYPNPFNPSTTIEFSLP
jgi:hypothetical protein